jgi:hypothetical protein
VAAIYEVPKMNPRKITNKGTKKVIGKFPSMKLMKVVWWESQLERDYIYLLEFDPDVISYKEQPLTIYYNSNGKKRRYTPDFLVERAAKRQIIEVKPEEHVTKEENALLFKSVTPLFNQEGYEFLIATDTMIRTQPRLSNIKLLTKYARTPINPQHQIECHEFFARKQEASLDEIINFFAAKHEGIQVVYSLLYHGVISIDLMQPIEPDSLVLLP